MTDSGGFTASDLHQVAALLDDGAAELGGMAGSAPSVPDAGGSSAAIAGALSALGGVVGSILDSNHTASGYVRAGSDAYRGADENSAHAFGGSRD
ncbi:MAG TPA: hypothetical protein VHX38_26520 [Pseudonocardiaceae bacterium]|jgi:hypothetical protein|nr:hypothetical protein [Pseudonocardiaceae bacterium]